MSRRIVSLLSVCCCLYAQPPAAIVRIDGAKPRVAVSESLYGIFFEEINHSGEGGLYAELVRNRDFETATLPAGAVWAGNLLRTKDGWQERKWFGNALDGWTLVREGGARASMHLDDREPLNSQNPHSLRLNVGVGRASVVNSGYWGMNFQTGRSYDLRFHARSEGGTAFNVRIALTSASGRDVYATTIMSVGGGWKKYETTLRSQGTDRDGRLRLTVQGSGSLWFDVVSLFPRDTYQHRPNGLRADLVEMLAALKPAFLRFPGGAIVGGLNLDNRIQWKNSIGDIAQRKGTMNLWGYYTTNGLGFHEYLQLAEDLKADALCVCNPGFSDNYRHAEYAKPEEVDGFVREALDAIEYALGPVDSPWGSKRAANGHPRPFPLKYVEIGNEASGPTYTSNYGKFYRAIHERYPNLTIISNSRGITGAPVDMVDDHRYGSAESFYEASAYYDKADRKGPKIYVGEYGCNSGNGEGNWSGALAEAVFLLGLERNSDLVRMSSFAPLFFHVNDIAWPVNLIGFDSSRVVGRGSYQVQKLFAANRPSELWDTTVEDPSHELFATAGYDASSTGTIIKVVSRAAAPRNVRIVRDGLSGLAAQANVTTLSHPDLDAENTLDEPEAIIPRVSTVRVEGPVFSVHVPEHSVTVIRIPGKV
ncbi:MAG: alpha-L-arabinofuranosidase C-terminal domain-containing protein [Bryobacteraceae bacterium]